MGKGLKLESDNDGDDSSMPDLEFESDKEGDEASSCSGSSGSKRACLVDVVVVCVVVVLPHWSECCCRCSLHNLV